MRLLGRKTSGNVQKVIWLLEELKMPYTREDYGRQFDNNTQTPEYLAMNPNAKVPTLVDGEVIIWESNTILRYLATKATSALYPTDTARRTHVERWMDWQLAALNPPYLAMFKETKLEPDKRSADFPAQLKDFSAQLSILDKSMADRAAPAFSGAPKALPGHTTPASEHVRHRPEHRHAHPCEGHLHPRG
jgi:glutathione S-transferase